MDCELAQRHLDAYVDGELAPTAILEVEGHIVECALCQTQVEFARRLKNTLREEFAAPRAPRAVRSAVKRAMAHGESAGSRRRRLSHSGLWAAAAVAAAVCVWYFGGANYMLVGQPSVASKQQREPAEFRQASIFGDIVSRHQDHDPAEIDTPEVESAERWFEDKLQFRVRPIAFAEPQVRLVGARLSHVGRQRAAKLYYDVGNRRLTAVAFEATPEMRGILERRTDVRVIRVGNRVVRYHRVHGYTVPIIEQDGILYGFTGDIDEGRLLHLMGSVRLP